MISTSAQQAERRSLVQIEWRWRSFTVLQLGLQTMLRIAIQVKAAHFSWAWHGMAIVESRFDKKCLVVQVFLRPSGMSGEF